MMLFSRTAQLIGPPRDTSAYATGIAEFVGEQTGREISVWMAVMGAPNGTYSWATQVDGLADVATVMESLLSNDEYHDRLVAGADFVGGPSEDSLGRPLNGDLPDMPPAGSVAAVTQAVMAPGRYDEAVAFGVDIAQHVKNVAGIDIVFLGSAYGPMGAVAWIGSSENAAAVDAANAALNADADYLAKVNAAGSLFIPGSGSRRLSIRIA